MEGLYLKGDINMSIKARLAMMLVLGLVIPILLVSLVSPLVGNGRFNGPMADMQLTQARYLNKPEVKNTIKSVVDELTIELEKNPDKIYDNIFMDKLNDELQEIQASVVVSSPEEGHIYVMEGFEAPFKQIDISEERLSDDEIKVFDWKYQFIMHRTFQFKNTKGSNINIMILTKYEEATKVKRLIFRNITMIVTFFIIVYTVLVYHAARSITKPLEKLKIATEKITDGDFTYRIGVYTKDKIGEVSKAFDYMMERAETAVTLKRKYEDNRKELIASISHDLKTPLTAIKINAASINDGIADTEEKKEKAFAVITNKIEYMQTLIEELFLYSKLDMNNEEFKFQEVPLNRFVEDVVEEWEMEHNPEDVKVVFDYKKSDSYLMDMDVDKLKRVMVNILDNSVKYGGVKPLLIHMDLKREYKKNKYILSINDNGVGVPEEETKKLFDHFYRVDVSRNSETSGSGLGLAISKRIIEGHQGSIEAISGLNKGMHISVTLNAKREVI